MFRVTIDRSFNSCDYYYVHKKLFFWWVKWYIGPKTNSCSSSKTAYDHLKKGKYNFDYGEHSGYFMAVDLFNHATEILYVDTPEEFKDKFIEEFI